ncbi:Uma2 family endonuclease [Candidatus Poribacteria bacterium]|nr:Uma2 family endonuclease [Candidatus Poribacteria bacterium]MYK96601.1 Uma2 family endonuclease [Candidatus Poribacteria bacterium]
METRTNTHRPPYAPTETTDLYPESDGKPMADTDLHLYWIKRIQDMIETHFSQNPEAYISGNIMMYDIEGPMRTAVSPDILVAFGLGQKFRRTYKVWEEGKPPDFVMEFSSKRTYRNDLDEKMAHYARMEIPEYVLYDPDRRFLPSPLMGFRLVEGTYVEIAPDADGGIRSEILGLNFHLTEDGLAIYDPRAQKWLQTRAEQEAARAEQEAARAEQEAAARQKAEAEVERLQAEIARLKAQM